MTLADDIRRASKELFVYVVDYRPGHNAEFSKWSRTEDGWRSTDHQGVHGPFKSLCDVWYYCGGDVRPEQVEIRYKHRFLKHSEIVMFDNPLARREYNGS